MDKLRQIIREEIRKMLIESPPIIKFMVPPKYGKILKDKVIANLLTYVGKNKKGDVVIGVNYKDREELKKRLKSIEWSEII